MGSWCPRFTSWLKLYSSSACPSSPMFRVILMAPYSFTIFPPPATCWRSVSLERVSSSTDTNKSCREVVCGLEGLSTGTVKPMIKDPPNKARPLNERHFPCFYCIYISDLQRRALSIMIKMAGPKPPKTSSILNFSHTSSTSANLMSFGLYAPVS